MNNIQMTKNTHPIPVIGRHRAGGFTIIETLVAITILMIAVAGPLSVAGKGLTAALYARDQIIATFLAQESMEVIKNLRDNNLATASSWLSGLSGCTSAAPCDASALLSPSPIKSACSGGCLLYITDTGQSVPVLGTEQRLSTAISI